MASDRETDSRFASSAEMPNEKQNSQALNDSLQDDLAQVNPSQDSLARDGRMKSMGRRRLEPVPVDGPDPKSKRSDNERRTLSPDEEAPKAPEGMRYIGYCQDCRDFVELTDEFACAKGGHGRDRVRVALLYREDDPLPHMPRVNLGALFMPALWGPVHGQWYMILYYPLWLVLDNIIYASVHGVGNIPLTVIACALTAAFTIYYAIHANTWGYVRVASEKTPEEYLHKERIWAVVFILMAVAFLVLATWYNIARRPYL